MNPQKRRWRETEEGPRCTTSDIITKHNSKSNTMKKILTTCLLLMAAVSMSAQGNQKIIYDDTFGYDFSIRGAHPDFSYGGKVQLFGYSRNYTEDGETTTFTLFDDNFDMEREWTTPSLKADYYTQEYVAEITGYNVEKENENIWKEYDASTGSFSYYDDNGVWIEVSGPLTIENARHYIKRYGYTVLNEVTTNEGTYFYLRYFLSNGDGGNVTRSRALEKAGLQSTDYPIDWFWLTTDGSLNRVNCTYRVTAVVGDNYVEGEKQYGTATSLLLRPYFYDYDAPYELEADCRITQTLFNDDAKFEYIRPLLTDGLSNVYVYNNGVYDSDLDCYVSVPCISKTYGARQSGFQVVSEDGTVLQTVNFDGNFVMRYDEMGMLRINGKLYLSFEGNVIDEPNNSMRRASLIYELDRQSSQIRKVMEHVSDVTVTPRVADRSDQITVELNDEGGIREIMVVNGSGQTEVRVPVAKGQKRVTIPASQLSRGMNMVKSVGGRNRQAHKVIVK